MENRQQRTDWNEVRLPGKLPDRRSNHCTFLLNDYLYIHGGRDIKEGPMSDMWRLSMSGIQELMADSEYGVSWEQVQCKGTIPGKISHHCSAVFGHSVVVYGGIVNSEQNVFEAYEFDSNKNFWSKMKQTGDVPKPRDDHAQCQISDCEFMIFGGFVEGSRTNETYHCKKTGSTLEWTVMGEGCDALPQERASHSMAFNEGKCYIYGGQDDDNNKLNDVWELDCASGQFKCLELGASSYQPIGRSGHSANIYNGRMYIFGGIFELAKETNEMMMFDFTDNTFACIEGSVQQELARSPTKVDDESPSPQKRMTLKGGSLNLTAKQGKSLLEKEKTKKEEKKDEKKESGLASPTSISMQNSFIIQNADESFDAYYTTMKKRKHGQAVGMDSQSPGMGQSPGENSASFGVVNGVQPDAREGHSCNVGGDGYMFVFGGDRHHMPFNDMHLYYIKY